MCRGRCQRQDVVADGAVLVIQCRDTKWRRRVGRSLVDPAKGEHEQMGREKKGIDTIRFGSGC